MIKIKLNSFSKILSQQAIWFFFIFLLTTKFVHPSSNQKIELIGKIIDYSTKKPLANTNIQIFNQDIGTISDESGNYRIFLPPGTYTLIFSYIGYYSQQKTITLVSGSEPLKLNIALKPKILPGQQVSITAQTEEPRLTRFEIPPAKLVTIANPLPDALISLKTLPGVSSGNDQSTFYNVRGGNYDENLIYLNGVEIYQPILVRKGIAENPSLVNPDLIQSINLRTGAFPVCYGDKLSSVLDISYRDRDINKISGRAELSSIKTGLTVEGPFNDKGTWILGLRRINYGYLFNVLQTTGNYSPDFRDIQLGVNYHLNSRNQLKLFGLYGNSRFKLTPKAWASGWRLANTEIHYMDLHGSESFTYQATAVGLQWLFQVNDKLRWQLSGSLFKQQEYEDTHVEYYAILPVDSTRWQPDSTRASDPGRVETYDNRLHISLARFLFNGSYQLNPAHQINWGLELKRYRFNDRLEQQVESIPRMPTDPDLMFTNRIIPATGISAYGEYRWQPGTFVSINGGLRFTRYDFNHERLFMPRFQMLFHLSDSTDIFLAAGRYAQPPLYKELRGHSAERVSDLRSQKATQVTAGLERRWGTNMSLRMEVYYKWLRDLISYDIWDVRLVYSGYNDAIGYVYGLDAHLRGDFIPDCLAWLSYSYMVAREDLAYDNEGWVPRPSDQRHCIAATLQDKMVRFPGSRIHIRILISSGFPFTYQLVRKNEAGAPIIVTSRRNSWRAPDYQRFDIGFTQKFRLFNLDITLRQEILNLFDRYNVLGYSWISGARVEHGLSRRTFDVGIQVEF